MEHSPDLEDFYILSAAERRALLQDAICREHTFHYANNRAYRRTLSGRGLGEQVRPDQFAGLLRLAALTFKEYIEWIGPFPQSRPEAFVEWLEGQVSLPLLPEPRPALRPSYTTQEALLQAVEALCAGVGVEIVTSSGTSGRASFVPRDRAGLDLAVKSFFTGIRRTWGVARGMAMIFVMPGQTRVAMARVARLGVRQTGWGEDSPIYYTVPFAATPDLIRIRTGRLFRPGLAGLVERRLLYPGMNWAFDHLALGQVVKETRRRLDECIAAGKPLMLLGGLSQLHALALDILRNRPTRLPPGSRVATGGGVKERYHYSPAQIRCDLEAAFPGVPVGDVYGMAEANWAAFECSAGNYHLPPWLYAVVTDEEDRILDAPEATGLLAFFDPIGGGRLVPPFFQTADQVRLVGSPVFDPQRACPCGEQTAYLAGAIQRVDLIEEAGCAGQI